MSDLFDTPLRRRARDSGRFHRLGCAVTSALHQPRVYGTRALCWPAISLSTDIEMGPSRHTLSQIVVAGTVQYLPPFPPPARPSAPPPSREGLPETD